MTRPRLEDVIRVNRPTITGETTPAPLTRQIDVTGNAATVTLKGTPATATEAAAADVLAGEGLNPDAWTPIGYRTSAWTMANGEEGVSRRFTFARTGPETATRATLPADLIRAVRTARKPATTRATGDHAFIVALGDLQLGKNDDGGTGPTFDRAIASIDAAAVELAWARKRYPIGEVLVALLGDHVEGVASQGGRVALRSDLELDEQILAAQAVFTYALRVFAPLAGRVILAAVPGNHGDTNRAGGKGQATRSDSSFDTLALRTVAQALPLMGRAYEHVEVYTPEPDEMTVTVETAGTRVTLAHGHQWGSAGHEKWWSGQAFHGQTPGTAHVLLAGHRHTYRSEALSDGRWFIQAATVEGGSTWYRHKTGATSDRGAAVAVVTGGTVMEARHVRPLNRVMDEAA